jgi:hypothetical protein
MPPTKGMKSSVVCTAPPRMPFRRIALPSVKRATALPMNGNDRESRRVSRTPAYRLSCAAMIILNL